MHGVPIDFSQQPYSSSIRSNDPPAHHQTNHSNHTWWKRHGGQGIHRRDRHGKVYSKKKWLQIGSLLRLQKNVAWQIAHWRFFSGKLGPFWPPNFLFVLDRSHLDMEFGAVISDQEACLTWKRPCCIAQQKGFLRTRFQENLQDNLKVI